MARGLLHLSTLSPVCDLSRQRQILSDRHLNVVYIRAAGVGLDAVLSSVRDVRDQGRGPLLRLIAALREQQEDEGLGVLARKCRQPYGQLDDLLQVPV